MRYVQLAGMALLCISLVAGLVAAVKPRSPRAWWREPSSALLLLLVVAAWMLRVSAEVFPSTHRIASPQAYPLLPDEKWSAGFSLLLQVAFLVLPPNVDSAAAMNAVLGALTVPAVFALATTVTRDRLSALAAAAAYAFQPVSIRYAASDSQHVLLALCLILAVHFLLRWRSSASRLDLAQGIGWFTLGANTRIEGFYVALIGGAVLLAGDDWRGALRRVLREWRLLLVAAALVAFPAVQYARYSMGGGGVDRPTPFGFLWHFFLGNDSPALVSAAAVVGGVALFSSDRRRALAFLMVLAIAGLPVTFLFERTPDTCYRYALPVLAMWTIVAGRGLALGAATATRWLSRVAGPAAAGAVRSLAWIEGVLVVAAPLAAAWPHRDFLHRMWTHAAEYRFLVQHLGAIPDDCAIVYPGPDADWQARGLRLGSRLSLEVGRRHRWVSVGDGKLDSIDGRTCAVFYRSTLCFAYEPSNSPGGKQDWEGDERPECRRVFERFDLEPIVTTTFEPFAYAEETYVVHPVPAGFYRIHAR